MKTNMIIRWTLLVLLVGTISWAFIYRQDFDITFLDTWVQKFGVWAALIFIGVYAFATVLFLPGLALTLAGGVLFGPIWGTFYNLTGATLGATIAFLISRYLAFDWVRQKSGGRLKRLLEGVEEEGWRFVAFVRLVPLFPFNLLNYTLGLTKIKLSHYILVSYICMFPAGLAYTYLGAVGREAIAGDEGLAQIIQKSLLALGLLAVILFLPRFVKRLRGKTGSTISK